MHTHKCTHTCTHTQSTEFKKVNNLKDPSEDPSVPLGRDKQSITSVEGGTSDGKRTDGQGVNGQEEDLV